MRSAASGADSPDGRPEDATLAEYLAIRWEQAARRDAHAHRARPPLPQRWHLGQAG